MRVCGGVGDILVGQGVKKVESISCSGGGDVSEASRRQSRPRTGEKKQGKRLIKHLHCCPEHQHPSSRPGRRPTGDMCVRARGGRGQGES